MSRLRAHFLHIGKTGGTAVKHALGNQTEQGDYHLLLHPHKTKLYDVPCGEKVLFCLRDPISRFVSGFYSRMRQGKPRYHYPWSKGEAEAFARFTTANELAEALSAPAAEQRRAAQAALQQIQHVRDSVWSWIREPDYFHSRLEDVLFVGFQESLDQDFEALKAVLGIDTQVRLPTAPEQMHRNPTDVVVMLSECARSNLAVHYSRDIEFVAKARKAVALMRQDHRLDFRAAWLHYAFAN